MKSKLLLFSMTALFLILMQSCHLQFGTLQFDKKQADLQSSDQIKSFIKSNPQPTIVLKVPITKDDTASSRSSAYYNYLIEKELVKSGFKVKDANLFNEVIKKSSSSDYNKLKEITGVDLILELVTIKKDIRYYTDRFYTNKGEERLLNDYSISRYGAIIEFKLVLLGTNEYVGTYTFYYSPCSDDDNSGDCSCVLGYKNGLNKIYPKKNWCGSRTNPEFDPMDENSMEDFFIESVQNMVLDIKDTEK